MATRAKPKRKLYQVYDLRTGRPVSDPVNAYSEAQACGFIAVHILGDRSMIFYLEGQELKKIELEELDADDRCPRCGYYDNYPPKAGVACPNCDFTFGRDELIPVAAGRADANLPA